MRDHARDDRNALNHNQNTMPSSAASHVKETPPLAPPEPPKVKLPETEAELEVRRANVLAAMWGPKPEKAPEKPAEKPADEAPPAAVETTAEPPPALPEPEAKKEPEKPSAPPAPEPVDHHDLIAQTAKKIGEEVGQAIKDSKPERPEREESSESELTPEDARDAEIIAKMEELDPALKGKSEAFKRFAHQRYDYETAWRNKHPGAEFNPDDPEHEDFYKRQPEIDPDAFETAKIEVLVDRRVSQKIKPIEERDEQDRKQAKTDRAINAHVPKIVENVNALIVESVTAVNPEVAKLLGGMNALNLTKEEQEKLEDQDPITARVMGPLVRDEMIPMLIELEKSAAPGSEYELDPRNNHVHANIAKFVAKFETEASSKKERRDGKSFLTISQMNARREQIVKQNVSPEIKQHRLSELSDTYWTASVGDIQKTIVEDVSKRAKAAVNELEGMFKKKYKPEPKATAAKPAAAPASSETQSAPVANGKPRPPSVASQATVVDTSRNGKVGEKSFGETAVEVHFGR